MLHINILAQKQLINAALNLFFYFKSIAQNKINTYLWTRNHEIIALHRMIR